MGLWDVGNGTGKYSSAPITEAAIVTKAMKALVEKYPRAFVLKTHGGSYQRAGIPDVYVLVYGVSIWLEAKRPGGDTTALQREKLMQLREAGAYVGTFTSAKEAVESVEQALMEEINSQNKL